MWSACGRGCVCWLCVVGVWVCVSVLCSTLFPFCSCCCCFSWVVSLLPSPARATAAGDVDVRACVFLILYTALLFLPLLIVVGGLCCCCCWLR